VTVIDSGERFSIALVLSTNKNKKIKKYCSICFEIVKKNKKERAGVS